MRPIAFVVCVLFAVAVYANDHLMLLPMDETSNPAVTTQSPAAPSTRSPLLPRGPSDASPAARPVYSTGSQRVGGGYLWTYSDGTSKVESFADYTRRTKKFCCTSGYCSSPAAPGTPALAGCTCGCAAEACNCEHSPGVHGKGGRAAGGAGASPSSAAAGLRSLRHPGLPYGAGSGCAACARGLQIQPLRRLFRR